MKILTTFVAMLMSSSAYSGWDWFSSSVIKDDEQVIFFPAEASQAIDKDTWTLHFHGWIFEPETLGEINSVLRKALALPTENATEHKNLLQQRTHWFKVDNERGKRITIKLGNKTHAMKKSTANGHFSTKAQTTETQIMSLLSANNEYPIQFHAQLPKKDKRSFQGDLLLVPRKGLSIISDIDDTIKISNVSDKKELIRNTFLRPFKAAPGMATIYRRWQRTPATVFHYVSASPWQLYPELKDFMDKAGFPRGLFYMKDFRWKDSSFLNLFADPVEYKMNILESILKRYPQRQFILVGDSGEKDPEVYAKLARKYPTQITRILIRKVGENNSDDRFNAAFAGMSAELWQSFSRTDEIETPE